MVTDTQDKYLQKILYNYAIGLIPLHKAIELIKEILAYGKQQKVQTPTA